MGSLVIWVMTHAYALLWLTGHINLVILLLLVFARQWTLLIMFLSFLFACAHVTFSPRPELARKLHKNFLRAFNGVQSVRLDVPYNRGDRVMFCFHPHAIVANGFGLAMYTAGTTTDKRITIAVAHSLFWLNPAFRWFVNIHGCDMCTVGVEGMSRVMKLGRPIGICPGGFEEVLLMKKHKDIYYLRRRRGFLRLARRFEYTVSPILGLGESQLYSNALQIPHTLAKLAARYGLPLVWPVGRLFWNFNPNPPSKGLLLVFGEIQRIDDHGTSLDDVQDKYIRSIECLYKRFNPYDTFSLEVL